MIEKSCEIIALDKKVWDKSEKVWDTSEFASYCISWRVTMNTKPVRLTEFQILRIKGGALIEQGYSNQEIADVSRQCQKQ
jgi:hypothetical protein